MIVQIEFTKEYQKDPVTIAVSSDFDEKTRLRYAVQKAVDWGLDLSGACLQGADLSGMRLCGAKLREADLFGATMKGVNLEGAYLAGAFLKNADLTNAYLAEADLCSAILSNTNLRGAYLAGAHVAGVGGIISLGQPDGWWAHAYLHNRVMMFRFGCNTKSLAEARGYWDKTHRRWPERQEIAACIEYAVTVAKLRGWKFDELS